MHRLRSAQPHLPESLPGVGRLINEPDYAPLIAEFGRERVVEAIREQLAEERGGSPAEESKRTDLVAKRLRPLTAPRLRRVINATGVILHTNLGRAPLSRAAAEAAQSAATYTNLELDLETGRRGERADLLSAQLKALFDADAGFAVNNNAAAVLLALTALCKGREVIVSRGQLVEIGGSFRMPDVMRLSGARMVEVGTTNRTRAGDYEAAITPRTAAILRVHTSNFRVSGFTEAPTVAELGDVARRHALLLIDDLGSGAMDVIADEPTIADSMRQSDVVTFSGDKLLGGPQAGIVLGRGEKGIEAVRKLARNPLARAVRIDKLTLAALEATLRQRITGHADEIPVERMLRLSQRDIQRRAGMWSVKLEERGVKVSLIPGESAVGGGSVPGHGLPTVLIAIHGPASRLAAALRRGDPPVIARIENDLCCLDPRTVLKGEDEVLIDAVEAVSKTIKP